MNRVLGFAGALCAAALATSAAAQQPLVQTSPNQHIVVTQPVVVSSGKVVTPEVAATTPNEVIPPVQVSTATPEPAPWKPAPLGTYIKTTADQRVVITKSGYDMITDVNGRREASTGFLTEGLGAGPINRPGVVAEFWPLQVGKSIHFNYGTDSVISVDARVLRTETVTVPAGTFYTYVIQRSSHPVSDFNETVATFWYAPSVGTIVKATSASFNGRGIRPFEAVSIVLPHPLNGIPVTVPGDTAARRAEFCAQHGTNLSLPSGQTMPVPCVTYVQANLSAYQTWLNSEAASVPVAR
jgi:hypothetical protein